MKKTILLITLLAATIASFGQTKPPVKKPTTATKAITSKFGALAIDRSNGFYYGWSFDHATLAEAEKKAIEECIAKGGNCTVVLSYSGAGCAAYRTIDGNVGTAFGWGVAKTKETADAIATRECLKRSNGTNPTNFVWSCNSANTGILKEIYNASGEIFPTVIIGSQTWAAADLDVTTFNNGDKIPYAASKEEWQSYSSHNKPAYTIVNSRKLYNGFAVHDPRGLAPKGFHIPTDQEWGQLVNYLGGTNVAGSKLKSKTGWFENIEATNSSLFNALPGGGRGLAVGGTDEYITYEGGWWSSTMTPSELTWVYILHYTIGSVYRTKFGNPWGYSVRLIKDE
jgi:uncharacterized protein (TIGR02145 family)